MTPKYSHKATKYRIRKSGGAWWMLAFADDGTPCTEYDQMFTNVFDSVKHADQTGLRDWDKG